MPRFDKTGPWGMGAGMGWGMGPCSGAMGWRRGLGHFWRKWGANFNWAVTEKEEKEMLQDELKALEEEMADVKERLDELKAK